MKTNGQKLMELRTSLGQTRKQFAKNWGLSVTTMYRYEKDITPINIFTACKLNKTYKNLGLTTSVIKAKRNKNSTSMFMNKIKQMKMEQKMTNKEFENRYGMNYSKMMKMSMKMPMNKNMEMMNMMMSMNNLMNMMSDGYSLDWLFKN